MGINDSIAGIGTPITKPTLKNLLCLSAKCQQRMIRSCTAFVGIISDRHSLLLAVGRFHSGVHVNHKKRNTPTLLVPLRSALRQIPARIRWFKLSISLMFFSVKVRSMRPNVVSSGILSQPATRLKTRSFQTVTIERIERAPPTMPTTDKMTMPSAS